MSREPEGRTFADVDSEPGLRFYVVKLDGWWKRHLVMFQIGEQIPEPFYRFWSWDRADDFTEGLNKIVKNREKHLLGRSGEQ